MEFDSIAHASLRRKLLVGLSGLEPPTSRLSGVRSNRLSYKPLYKSKMRLFLYGNSQKAVIFKLVDILAVYHNLYKLFNQRFPIL